MQNGILNTNRNYAGALIGRIRTGEAHFSNIKVINVEVHALVPAAKYTGGLIGGIETNTKLYMDDVYVNGLTISHQQSDMIGVVVGRIRAHAELNNVVLLNVSVTGRHNLGIVAGKEDNTTTLIAATNVFAQVDFTFQPDVSGIYSEYFGYIIGNPDAGNATVSNYFVTPDADFTGRSKGLNTGAQFIDDIEAINAAWWETNLPSIFNSDLWTIGEDGLATLN